MTLQDAQQEAYYAYDPASGIPEGEFTMEFIKSRYPQLITQPVAQDPTIRPNLKPRNMIQGALAPQEQEVSTNRFQGILSDNYVSQVPKKKKKSIKDRIKGTLLPDGWDVKGGSIVSPMGFSVGKNKLGYSTKF